MNRSMPFVLGAILLGALNPQIVWAKNYASVEIYNGTPLTTVHYLVRWGTGEWQKEVALKPGETWSHWWTYDFPDENRSPTLYLTFNSGINRQRTVMEYNLKKNSTVAKNRGGMPYYFDKAKDASGEDYIDLFQGTKPRPAVNLVQQGRDFSKKSDYDRGGMSYNFGKAKGASGEDDIDPFQGTKPRPAVSLVQQGRDFSNKGDYDQAIAKFNEALRLDPNQAFVYTDRAYAYTQKGQHDLALDDCEEALRRDPRTANAFNIKGVVYKRQGKYDLAIAEFSKAIRLKANEPGFFCNRGFTHFLKKNYDLALADADETLRLNPKMASAFDVKGAVYSDQGKYDMAINEFSKAIGIDSRVPVFFSNRGFTHFRKKNYDLALADADEALRLNPKMASAFNVKGAVYLDQGKYDMAINEFSKAIGIDSRVPVFFSNRAKAHYRKKNYDRVIEDYTESLRLKPGNAGNHNNRGLAYFALEKYDDAIADYSEAIRIDGKLAVAWSNRGGAYLKKGDYDRAIRDTSEALAISPDLDRAYWWRSQAYAKKGETGPSRADYDRSVKLNPANQTKILDITDAGKSYVEVSYRQEALKALRSFRMGSTMTPEKLTQVNRLPSHMQPLYKSVPVIPKETLELIEMEKMRAEMLEFEMMAAVDKFLSAARLSDEARKASGLQLDWLYGNVSSPLKRDNSMDDLGGMRLIGNLKFEDGREMNAIIPLTFYVASRGDDGESGGPGILFAGDNFRVEVQLFQTGTVRSDYAHQSFSIGIRGAKMDMRPGLYLEEKTGMLINRFITSSALGVSCIDCHSKGPRLKPIHYKLMKARDYQAMEGFQKFLDQAETLGATKKEIAELEAMMAKDPALLVPLDDILRANEEQWISRYSMYKKRLNGEAPELPKQKDARQLQSPRERLAPELPKLKDVGLLQSPLERLALDRLGWNGMALPGRPVGLHDPAGPSCHVFSNPLPGLLRTNPVGLLMIPQSRVFLEEPQCELS